MENTENNDSLIKLYLFLCVTPIVIFFSFIIIGNILQIMYPDITKNILNSGTMYGANTLLGVILIGLMIFFLLPNAILSIIIGFVLQKYYVKNSNRIEIGYAVGILELSIAVSGVLFSLLVTFGYNSMPITPIIFTVIYSILWIGLLSLKIKKII